MNDLHSNLVVRLNYLIGLLDISSRHSFDKIKDHRAISEFDSVGEIYDNQYAIYKNQITTSAILLGYAHFGVLDRFDYCLS